MKTKINNTNEHESIYKLSRENPTASDFDYYYSKEDPWGAKNNIMELAKKTVLNDQFRDCSFNNGLDIGCGEGHLTASLNFVKKFEAIDVSNNAITRAKSYYPSIDFKQMDARNLSFIKDNNYDFISCLETLYYFSENDERERVLIDIKAKGKGSCVYLFSVVTIGQNEHRRYFKYEEAMELFRKHFNVIHHFPIRTMQRSANKLSNAYYKLKNILLSDNECVNEYLSKLKSTKPEEAYQCAFILTKN